MDEQEQKALSDIAEHGCHILHVLAEGELPPFSYSIGIWKTVRAPELIVVGLKQGISHSVINEYCRRVRAGEAFPDGTMSGGFLGGFDCLFREIDKGCYADYLGWGRWLYGGNGFPVLQMIYPTTSGVWPWDAAASSVFKRHQPCLYSPASH